MNAIARRLDGQSQSSQRGPGISVSL